jgi:hypothetical protein
MPYETRWLIQDRIVHTRYYGHLTLDELHEAAKTIRRHFEGGQAPVHHIADLTALESYPLNMSAIRQALGRLHSKSGWHIIIVSNPVLHFLSTTISRLFPIEFQAVPRFKDALAFLKAVDPSVNKSLNSHNGP